MSEKDIVADIRLGCSRGSVRLFQNVVGLAYLKRKDGTYQKYKIGLGVGTSDLIGLVSRVVTPDMVGKTIAQFLAVEVKTPKGRLSPEQKNFIEMVKGLGGAAFVARSQDEVHNELRSLGKQDESRSEGALDNGT